MMNIVYHVVHGICVIFIMCIHCITYTRQVVLRYTARRAGGGIKRGEQTTCTFIQNGEKVISRAKQKNKEGGGDYGK